MANWTAWASRIQAKPCPFMAGQVKDGPVYAAYGDAAQSLVDARDITAAAAAVLQNLVVHTGTVYTLTGDKSLTTWQFVHEVSRADCQTWKLSEREF